MVIRVRERERRQSSASALKSVLENRRRSAMHKPAAVLLPHPIKRSESRFVKVLTSATEAGSVFGHRPLFRCTLLLEEPSQLVDVIEVEGRCEFLSCGCLEDSSGLRQMSRNEQANFPRRQSAQQFNVAMEKRAKIDRRLAVHEV